jgi:hypothetical protein
MSSSRPGSYTQPGPKLFRIAQVSGTRKKKKE